VTVSLLRQQSTGALVFDLLDSEIFKALVRSAKILEETLIDWRKSIVAIDKVQRLPLSLMRFAGY
jgi:hypothetical protein